VTLFGLRFNRLPQHGEHNKNWKQSWRNHRALQRLVTVPQMPHPSDLAENVLLLQPASGLNQRDFRMVTYQNNGLWMASLISNTNQSHTSTSENAFGTTVE